VVKQSCMVERLLFAQLCCNTFIIGAHCVRTWPAASTAAFGQASFAVDLIVGQPVPYIIEFGRLLSCYMCWTEQCRRQSQSDGFVPAFGSYIQVDVYVLVLHMMFSWCWACGENSLVWQCLRLPGSWVRPTGSCVASQ
jgi:hypothetical protein